MDAADLLKILSKLAVQEPTTATLYRLVDSGSEPEPTGASLTLGQTDGRRFVQVNGIEGELPPNIRIEDGKVKVSSRQEPENWIELQGSDAEALRVFCLLDPRLFVDNKPRVDVLPSTSDHETYAVGHVDLLQWQPRLPEAFLKWLKGDAYDRPVGFRIDRGQLVETMQPDLYPRRADQIIARFEAG